MIVVTSPWSLLPTVRLHLKTLTTPTVPIATMVTEMAVCYATRGIRVEIASRENLNLPALDDLDAGQCVSGSTTQEQRQLFGNRNFVGQDEVTIYFINSTVPPYNGCAVHPDQRPGAVVASGATMYTLAHEVGHVLDLDHVNNNNRLMTENGTTNITNPPPNLTKSEGDKMKDSDYTIDL